MLLCDMELFFAGVARKLYDFHSVQQRSGDSVRGVCSRNEQHIAQIHRYLEVVIGERGVLFGVENFEHSGGRISLVVAAHFVYLIEQDNGIHAFSLFDRVYDTSRHCTDICFSVTAYLCFITHTAE